MMKVLIINLFAIPITSVCFSQNLKMELVIQKCIDASSRDTVTFIIENPTDSDIWIKPDYLTFYFGVCASNGEIISRKTTRHLNRIGSNFFKIGKKSKKELKWTTDFFDNYQFELNKEYYVECGYEPPHLTRKEKREIKESNINLPENQFSGKSNLFRICKI